MKKVHNNNQNDHTKKSHVCHFCIAFKGRDFFATDPFRGFRLSRVPICNAMVSKAETLFSSLQLKFAQCHTWVMKIIAKHKKNAQYILHSIFTQRKSILQPMKVYFA